MPTQGKYGTVYTDEELKKKDEEKRLNEIDALYDLVTKGTLSPGKIPPAPGDWDVRMKEMQDMTGVKGKVPPMLARPEEPKTFKPLSETKAAQKVDVKKPQPEVSKKPELRPDTQIQKQPVVEISDTVLEYPSGPIPHLIKSRDGVNSPKYEFSEGYRQHVNPAIETQLEISADKNEAADKAALQYEDSRAAQLQRMEDLKNFKTTDTPSPYEEKIKLARQENEKVTPPEPMNPVASLIADLIPVVLGAAGGEAGKKAALPSFKLAQDLKSKARDQDIELYKARKSELKDKYTGLIDAEKLFREDKFKKDELRFKAIQDALNRGEKINAGDMNWAKFYSGQAFDVENKAVQNTLDASKNIMASDQKNFEHLDDVALKKEEMALREKLGKLAAEAKKRAGAGVKKEKPTEGNYNSALHVNNMMQAENMLDGMYKGGVLPSARSKFFNTLNDIDTGKFGNATVSALVKEYARGKYSPAEMKQIEDQITAEKNFIAPIVRKESGAAVSISEWIDTRRRYFDSYGDTPEQSKAKKKLRESYVRQMKTLAGPVPIDYEQTPGGRANAPKSKVAAVPSGPTFPMVVRKDGKRATVSNAKELKEAQAEGWN